MSRIAQCPACNAPLVVPSVAGASALLRCPSCDAEFELEDATATTLPEAVLLETSAAANVLDFEGAEPDDVDPEMAVEEGFDSLDDDVDDDHVADDATNDSPFEDVTDEVMDDLVVEEATTEATVGAATGLAAPAAADEGDDDLVMVIPVKEPEEAAPWTFGESSDQPQSMAVGPAAATTASPAVVASVASRAAAFRRPKKSFLRHAINFFGGGVIGLALGYFILLWIGGPDRDFLELGNKLPTWMVPASFNERPFHGPPVVAEMPTTTGKPTRRPPQPGFADLAKELPQEPPEATPEVPENMPDATAPETRAPETTTPETTTPETTTPETTTPETTTPEDAGEMPASPFDALDTEPATPVVLGLRDAQPVAIESLAKAIDAAREIRADLLDGKLADRVTRAKKGKSYIVFCALAETMTRAANATASGAAIDAPKADLLFQLDAARQAIAETIAGEKALSEVGTICRLWLGNQNRTNRGVIAVGHMRGTYDCAPYAGLLLKLEGVPSLVPVVSTQPLPHTSGDRIVVAGLVVDAPADHLTNFPQTPPRVIYAGQTFGAK